jgi:predicted RNase H-like HicB family nuclease
MQEFRFSSEHILSMLKYNTSNITFQVLKQGKYFIAVCSVLDLSTQGNTLEEAKKRMIEVIDIFFQEIVKKDVVEEVLDDLGWEKIGDKMQAPNYIETASYDLKTFAL